MPQATPVHNVIGAIHGKAVFSRFVLAHAYEGKILAGKLTAAQFMRLRLAGDRGGDR